MKALLHRKTMVKTTVAISLGVLVFRICKVMYSVKFGQSSLAKGIHVSILMAETVRHVIHQPEHAPPVSLDVPVC